MVDQEYGSFSLADALAVQRLSEQDSTLGRRVKSALDIIGEALQRYGDALALSFNGGKDCTVLVHLFVAARHIRCGSAASQGAKPDAEDEQPKSMPLTNGKGKAAAKHDTDSLEQLSCIYVQCQSPFPQVEKFVLQCQKRYSLDLMTISAGMKEALKQYKERRSLEGVEVEAVLVGTRIGDPFADELEPFTMTDPHWPPLMRVHPILDWTYKDIWDFLRCPDLGKDGVGWCSLYNYGYTSLGSTFNTIPNPLLRDPSRPSGWKPAWELMDASAERAGRPAGPIPKEVTTPLDHQTNGKEAKEKGAE